MNINTGKSSEDEFIFRMESRKTRTKVFRNRDKKDLMGLNRRKNVTAFSQPADFTVATPGSLMWAEVKSLTTDERFDYSRIEPGQRSASGMCASIGAPYYFFIHHMATGRWFELSAEVLHSDLKAGKKSRRLEELLPCTFF